MFASMVTDSSNYLQHVLFLYKTSTLIGQGSICLLLRSRTLCLISFISNLLCEKPVGCESKLIHATIMVVVMIDEVSEPRWVCCQVMVRSVSEEVR